MNIGVWIDENAVPQIGGGYSYSSKLVQLIDSYKFSEDVNVSFLHFDELKVELSKPLIKIDRTEQPLAIPGRYIFSITKKFYSLRKWKAKFQRKQDRKTLDHIHEQLRNLGIDCLYYLAQMQYAIPNYPFITTNWDLGHLTLPPFPEVTQGGQAEKRKKWYEQTIRKSHAVICESEAGKKEFVELINYPEHRVFVLPIFPSDSISIEVDANQQEGILDQFNLKPGNYFFYPAQFWKHKNHFNLLAAFKTVSDEHRAIDLVLSGSDRGAQQEVRDEVNQLGLSAKVHFLGFVSDEEMVTLYRNAVALVMPTLLGPTNMPPLEARALNCPVLISDFEGHREQLGKGALYFDPLEVEDIGNTMREILDPARREEVLKLANDELLRSKFSTKNVQKTLEQILSEISLLND